MSETIGFIGLGIMGRPMAGNLLDAGYPLVVHNRSRASVDELAQRGAQRATSAAEVARRSEVVITMLPDSPQVSEVLTQVLDAAKPGLLAIDMSTIAPAVARDLAARGAERGIDVLDAPVSGGDVGAREGTLSIGAGGTEAAFERARPIFEVLGKTTSGSATAAPARSSRRATRSSSP